MRPIFGNSNDILTRKCENLFDLEMRLHALKNTPPTGFSIIDNKNLKSELKLQKSIKNLRNEIKILRNKTNENVQ